MATKQTETRLSNRLPNEQYTKLADIAARDGRSVDDLLAEVVEEYVHADEPTSDSGMNGDVEANDDAESSVVDDADETEEQLHPQTRVGRHSSYF
ncbi:hypothetical protein AUR64_13560 [Haloprofundus marisrubri]|uniref:Ribbon-helix-helix protein CopG domain-containing protein n=1 Tax=Haloprofundus marisrubri TaxID=1514971 RepID=A0A0W1R6V8_9EURY|nr:hypothetical protein [Haloprofundus marisrubri]KTG08839.1 hypothetical protein AUR64_13560 [Haloprofundus marisrubri]